MIRVREMVADGLPRWEVAYYDEFGMRRRRKFGTQAEAFQFKASLLEQSALSPVDPRKRLVFTVPFVACKRHRIMVQEIKNIIGRLALDRSEDMRFYRPCRVVITIFHKERTGKSPLGRMPDVDNVAKAALDAMTGCVYADDQQVFEVSSKRVLSTEERTLIEVEYLSDEEIDTSYREARFRQVLDTKYATKQKWLIKT